MPKSLRKRPAILGDRKIIWPNLLVFSAFHLLLPLAFLDEYFSWTGVALVFLGNYVFGSLGVNIGFHRLLTHRGFECPKWLEHGFALLGVCTLQDSPGRWVAIHRMHHQHADEPPDPHSPLVSFFWGHLGWLIVENRSLNSQILYEKYARDIFQDRFYLQLHRKQLWLWIYAAHAAIIFSIAYGVGWVINGAHAQALRFGLGIFLWGVVVRTVYVWHITWAVNSVTHLWGYRNYETGENSRNNWVVALLTNGEGWHNNHHQSQRSASHGHRWWEIDLTYWTILLLKKVGLAADIVPVMNTDTGKASTRPTTRRFPVKKASEASNRS